MCFLTFFNKEVVRNIRNFHKKLMSINVLEIKDLETFINVVESSSLADTSKELNVNQSTITKRINQLEEKVQGELFNRRSRPLRLTQLGEKVYFKARYILGQLEKLESVDEQEIGLSQEKVKVGISITLMDDLSEYLYEKYKFTQSPTEFDIYGGRAQSLIQQVQNKELELAIVMLPSNLKLPAHLSFLNIGAVPLVIVSKNVGDKQYSDLESCCKKGWVMPPEGCYLRELLSDALQEKQLSFDVNKQAFGIDFLLDSILNDEGLGVFPKPFFDYYMKSNNELEVVPIEDFKLKLNMGVIYSDKRYLDKVSYFSKILKQLYFCENPYN